ncbi:MAG TPA: HAMP domain-containing sensor histidine kinase [Bacteroidales bacterium]|nr:HAMP domain-containing sensor histidine kinase [Bacteroidales bacterium]
MNRNKFVGLIIMMLVSLIGIIWVQTIWIRNAVGIRNENFDYYVNSSLHDAASEIESSRKISFFNNFLIPDSDLSYNTSDNITRYVTTQSYSVGNSGNVSVRITNQSVTQKPGKEPVIVTLDTTLTTDSVSISLSSPDNPRKMITINHGNGVEGGKGSISVSQKDFINMLRKRSSEFQNMSDQMIAEVYQWEKTMDVDNKEIGDALERSLLYTGIKTPFEFAVIKNGKVTEGTYKKSDRNDFLRSKYKVRLFADNIIPQDMLLSVVFPERANYVLGSMAWILGGSLLFSLIILATFAMSLFFIIRQKKIADMKSDFLNNMTHEFKTPIATISLAADTITNPKVINDESSIRHFIGMIKKENSRMNKKVETILQIASLDKKEIDFKFENVSLHSIIEKAVDTIDIIVHQRDGKIHLKLDAVNSVIYGDEEHLLNLVNNLIDNAIKYSPESPDIAVTTKNNDRGIIMSVEDKGIGMSKSVQSRIFERFYRQTSGNVHDVKGFGLGLNYASAIIEAHKGNVIVTSEPGKGSRFDVFLPFNQEN